VDTAQASQYYDALIAAIRSQDASETQKGVLEIATTAESQALTADAVVITPAKLAAALGGGHQGLTATGYQKLPGGLIIQWAMGADSGVEGHQTILFPIAFPNAKMKVFVSTLINGSLPSTARYSLSTFSQNQLGQCQVYRSGPNDAGATPIILAIGY